jgi:hypothetical protein
MMCAAVHSSIGEQPAAPEAAMGQDAHAVVGMTLLFATRHDADADHPRDAIEPLESSIQYAENIVAMRYRNLNGYDWWCIAQCVSFAYSMIAKHGIEPCDVLVEQHMDGQHIGLDNGGTADLVLLVPFVRAIVIDWKLGYLEQDDAADHDQLSAYAMMAAHQYRLDRVDVWIFQPRQDRHRRQSGARYDAEALRSRYEWAMGVCCAANHPDARLSPGYPQCQHCDALIFCQAARGYIMRARDAVQLMGPPKDPHLLLEMAGARVVAQRFADEAKEYLRRLLMSGMEVPGLRLRSTGMSRSFSSASAVIQRAADNGHAAEAASATTISVGQLREAVGPELFGKTYGDLVEETPKAKAITIVKGS